MDVGEHGRRSPRELHEADLVLGAARIEAEAASRRGDPLYEPDKRHAHRLREQ